MAHQQFTCAYLVIAMAIVMLGQVNCDLMPGFERCDNSTTKVERFYVSACPDGATNLACKMKRGAKIAFALDFTSGLDFEKASSNIDLTGYGYSYDACPMGLACPVRAGQSESMVHKIRIPEELKARKSDTMTYYLKNDDTYERVVCIKFPIEVL